MKEQGYKAQVQKGDRFEFGKNWKAFLSVLNDERIETAEQSLLSMLECNDLIGKTFLDVGCGSGLFSLAAAKLGATVYSFDFDPNSVKCTQFLKEKYLQESKWTINEGSVLNIDYIKKFLLYDNRNNVTGI